MRKPLLLTAMLVLVCLSTLLAQTNIKLSQAELPNWLKPISEKPKPINLDDISLGYYFELLEDQFNLQNQTHFNRTVKVVSESSGVENAGQLDVSFDPSYQKLVIHQLEIEREGKKLNRLDLSKFRVVAVESDLSRLIYNGIYSAFTVLDDIRKDDKITFSYSLIGENPVFEGKFSDTYSLGGSEPSGLVHLVYIVPDGRKLNIRKHKGAISERQKKKGDLTYFYWEQPFEKIENPGSSTPFWYNNYPVVEVSEFSTWKQLADWGKRINPIPDIKSGSALDNFVQKLWKESSGDSLTYLEKSVDFVQNSIRYMGIEMGVHSHMAHQPELVFSQRYGDCKDKSLLLASMLKRKGIGSSLILANTYQNKELDKKQPNPSVFNHMVIAAVLDGEMIAIDPTISNQGGSIRNRYFPYYGKVLFLENGTKLNEVSKPVPSRTYFVEIVDVIELLDGGKANLKVTSTYYDHEADVMRSYFKETARNQIQKDNELYYQNLYKKAKKVKALTFEDDQKNNVFILREEYALDEYILQEDQNSAPAYSQYIYDQLTVADTENLGPISLSFPFNVNHCVKIINKDHVAIGFLNQEEEVVERDAYWYSKSVYSDKDTLKISYSFKTNDSFVPMERAKQYHDDYTTISESVMFTYFVNEKGGLVIGEGSILKGGINYYALALIVLVMLATVWFIVKKYNKTEPTGLINLYHENVREGIGGWLIFLGIRVLLGNLVIIALLFSEFSPISNIVWLGLNNSTNYVGVLIFVLVYLVAFSVIIVFNIYSTVLFFQRRDIFPQTYLLLSISSFLMMLFTYLILAIGDNDQFWNSETSGRDIYDWILSIIWCIYLYRSVRVKETFTVPYGSKYDREESNVEHDDINFEGHQIDHQLGSNNSQPLAD